jgi:hypothetical protein
MMDDQANPLPDELPADENVQRPAIPANADLYPDFVGSLIYDIRQLLVPIRQWATIYPMVTNPEDQRAAIQSIKARSEQARKCLELAQEAVRVETRPDWNWRRNKPAATDLRPEVLNLVESLRVLSDEESARRIAEKTKGTFGAGDWDPVFFFSAVPIDAPPAWIDPHRASYLLDTLGHVIGWFHGPKRIEITASWDDEYWRLDVFYEGDSFEPLQRTWEAYLERDSLLVFNYVMEGLALGLCQKTARLHGGDLDLRFASAPRRPGLPPLLDQLTIALRLRRANRV